MLESIQNLVAHQHMPKIAQDLYDPPGLFQPIEIRMIRKALLTVFIALSLSGCKHETVDASSIGAMNTSLTRLFHMLSTIDQRKYIRSVDFIKQTVSPEKMLIDLDGKHPLEVITYANELRLEIITDKLNELEMRVKALENDS